MKRIFPLILAIVMLASAFPAAHAVIWEGCQNCENPLTLCPDCNLDTYCPDCDICESCGYETPDNNTNDHTAGTLVVFEADSSESYTITVPAKLAPGQTGTVTLAGTWANNRVVTVTADENVTLVNSILESDTKTLKVTFDGISEAGDNTTAQTFTETISVAGIENALFGTWNGKFNYNVESAERPAQIAKTSYYGNVMSGEIYDTMPAVSEQYDFYLQGDYLYMYGNVNGWSVMLAGPDAKELLEAYEIYLDYQWRDLEQTTYGDILDSINGVPIALMQGTFKGCVNLTVVPNLPESVINMAQTFKGCTSLTVAPQIPDGVTNMDATFQDCTSLTTAPVIPESVTWLKSTFYNCTSLTGTVEINANPSPYNFCFYGVNMDNITLTGTSTILDKLAETAWAEY